MDKKEWMQLTVIFLIATCVMFLFACHLGNRMLSSPYIDPLKTWTQICELLFALFAIFAVACFICGIFDIGSKKERQIGPKHAKESSVDITPNYTIGLYLSGLVIFIVSVISFVVVVRAMILGYFDFVSSLMFVFINFLIVVISLLFLLVKNEIIYMLFTAFVFVGIIANTLSLLTGLMIIPGPGLLILFVIFVYLICSYSTVFKRKTLSS